MATANNRLTCGSWGPRSAARHPRLMRPPLHQALDKGNRFWAPPAPWSRVGELVMRGGPQRGDGAASSTPATEACMSVLRLMRAFTGLREADQVRSLLHGHADNVPWSRPLRRCHAPACRFPRRGPAQPPQHPHAPRTTTWRPLKKALCRKSGRNRRVIPGAGGRLMPASSCPNRAFWKAFANSPATHRRPAQRFDEVMTGFRIAYGGARPSSVSPPNLTTPGQVIGGWSARGGLRRPRRHMDPGAPAGPMYQAHPLRQIPGDDRRNKPSNLPKHPAPTSGLDTNHQRTLCAGILRRQGKLGRRFAAAATSRMFGFSL